MHPPTDMPTQRFSQFSLKLLFAFLTLVCCAVAFISQTLPWYREQMFRLAGGIIPAVLFCFAVSRTITHRVNIAHRLFALAVASIASISVFLDPKWYTGLAFIALSAIYLVIAVAVAYKAKGFYRAYAIGAAISLGLLVGLYTILVSVFVCGFGLKVNGALSEIAGISAGPFWLVAVVIGAVAAIGTKIVSRCMSR